MVVKRGLRLFIKYYQNCVGIIQKNINFNQLQLDKQFKILVLCVLWYIQAQITLVLLHYTRTADCGPTLSVSPSRTDDGRAKQRHSYCQAQSLQAQSS